MTTTTFYDLRSSLVTDCSLASFLSSLWTSGKAEADEDASEGGMVPDAERRAGVPGNIEPPAAPHHTGPTTRYDTDRPIVWAHQE